MCRVYEVVLQDSVQLKSLDNRPLLARRQGLLPILWSAHRGFIQTFARPHVLSRAAALAVQLSTGAHRWLCRAQGDVGYSYPYWIVSCKAQSVAVEESVNRVQLAPRMWLALAGFQRLLSAGYLKYRAQTI